MLIKKISLGWVNVSDIERAKKFFVDTLGMKVSFYGEEYKWMELTTELQGSCVLGLGQHNPKYDGPIKPGDNTILMMKVDDIIE